LKVAFNKARLLPDLSLYRHPIINSISYAMRTITSILALLLILWQGATAQNTFFKFWETPASERALRAVLADDGGFILAGEIDTTGTLDHSFSYILKLDSEGNIAGEKIIKHPGSRSYLSLISKYPGEDNSYLCIGVIDSALNMDKYSTLVLLKINSELETVWSHRFSKEMNKVHIPCQNIFVGDSLLYIQSNYQFREYNTDRIATLKIRLPYDSVAAYITPLDYTQRRPQDLRYNASLNSIDSYYLGSLYKSAGQYPMWNNFTRLDPDLNFIDAASFPGWNSSTVSLCGVDNNTFLITGSGSKTVGGTRFVNVLKMNNQDELLDSLSFLNDPDTNIYAGAGKNTMINGNRVFIASYYNADPVSFPVQNMPSWIQITTADPDLDVITHHFYGGDAVYLPYSIIPTPDGGGFVTGIRYDYTIPDNDFDIFALKFNSDGLVVNVPENVSWKVSDAIVYPNPGRDYLVIQSGPQVSGSVFRMFDMQGKMVIEQQLTSSQIRLNTGNLATGTYSWQLLNSNKVIESGKWVKGF